MKKLVLWTICILSIGNVHAKHVPGELIVKFKTGVNAQSFFQNKSITALGLAPKRVIHLSYGNLSVVSINNEKMFAQTLQSLKKNAAIEYAEPNFIYSIAVMPKGQHHQFSSDIPDDALFDQQWGLHNTGSNDPQGKAGVAGADINALKAWDIAKGSPSIKIAVIDTGVDYNHPDLKENIWVNEKEANGKPGVDDDNDGFIDDIHGYDFANNTGDPIDQNGHGTHCAGTIGAIHNNKLGISGVMSEVTIVPLKFLGADGTGSLENAVKAIDYATAMNVDIISNSWGGGDYSQTLFDAIKRASDKGIIFTAAAGNSSTNNDEAPSYPASYKIPNIVSVAALTSQNELADYSSYGKSSVHIAAPGNSILSTYKDGGYETLSGTSMATPYVSGVLGLLLSKEGRIDHDIMKERLLATSAPVKALADKTKAGSRIDAYNLLTDTRPEHNLPIPNAWKTVKLNKVFESPHPYKEGVELSESFYFPGAKFIRAKITKLDLEKGFDFLSIADASRSIAEKITGKADNYTTEYVEGDLIRFNFTSDSVVNRWGYLIEEVEVQ